MSSPFEPNQPPANPDPTAKDGPGPGAPSPPGPSQYIYPPTGLQYLYIYNFVFENPKWGLTVLFGTVCQCIPFIGPIVFLGHQYECIEHLHRRPHSIYPDFDFNNFVEYLKRGIWVFLVALVASLPLGFVFGMVGLAMPFISLLATEADKEVAGMVIGVVMGLFMVLILALVILAQLVLMPLSLRAGLMQEFGGAFDFGFVRDFIRRVWLDVLLGQLFVLVTYPIVLFLGALVCCVGIYPAVTLVTMAQIHLEFQLYELYLARGGQEIPLATDVPPVRVEGRG